MNLPHLIEEQLTVGVDLDPLSAVLVSKGLALPCLAAIVFDFWIQCPWIQVLLVPRTCQVVLGPTSISTSNADFQLHAGSTVTTTTVQKYVWPEWAPGKGREEGQYS